MLEKTSKSEPLHMQNLQNFRPIINADAVRLKPRKKRFEVSRRWRNSQRSSHDCCNSSTNQTKQQQATISPIMLQASSNGSICGSDHSNLPLPVASTAHSGCYRPQYQAHCQHHKHQEWGHDQGAHPSQLWDAWHPTAALVWSGLGHGVGRTLAVATL